MELLQPDIQLVESLSYTDLSTLCQINATWREFCDRDDPWQILYNRDFGNLVDRKLSWKLEYLLKVSPTRLISTGDRTNVALPPITEISSGIVQIAASGGTTVLVNKNNEVRIYGPEVGFSQVLPKFTSSPISKIAIHLDHCLFLTLDGKVWAFGSNEYGRLGIGELFEAVQPILVPNLPKIKDIATSEFRNFFLDTNGELWETGIPLSNSNVPTFLKPVPVVLFHETMVTSSFPPIEKIFSGTSCYFLTKVGGKYALINNDTPFNYWPVTSGNVDIATGSHILLADGEKLWVAGNNELGQLGLGNTMDTDTFVLNPTISNPRKVAVGAQHSLVLDDQKRLWSFGSNQDFQLGSGLPVMMFTPRNIFNPSEIPANYYLDQIAAGSHHSVFLYRRILKISPATFELYKEHFFPLGPSVPSKSSGNNRYLYKDAVLSVE